MSETHLDKSVKNISYALIGQTIGLLSSFILRMIFVKQLNEDFLGIDSLFTSLVSMLSLAELGIGSAINFSLYKPIHNKDTEKIKSLMLYYKNLYRKIGILIFILGVFLLPFLSKITGDTSVENIHFIFFLFVFNSSISYFYSYKKTLIIADQHRHITIVYRYLFFVLMAVGQSIVLLKYKNYIFYILLMILATFLENFTLSLKADKLYPYLKSNKIKPIDDKSKGLIKKNAFAMSFHKIGGIVLNSTDNIVISSFIGISTVGMYSNYLLITNALNLIFGQIFSAIIATIGNLGVQSDKEKLKRIFANILMSGFLLVSFSTVMLFMLLNPFISFWLGNKMLLPLSTIILIILNFYVLHIRRVVLTFRDALGLYWYDRYKPIFEASLNILLSIIFVKYLGLNGVFLGTILSMLLTSIWIEPYVLFKYAFNDNIKEYLKKMLLFFIVTAFIAIISFILNLYMDSFFNIKNIMKLLVPFFITIIVYLFVILICFHKNENFMEILSTIKKYIKKRN